MAIIGLKHNGERFIIEDGEKLKDYPRANGELKRLMVAVDFPPKEVIEEIKESTKERAQEILKRYI